jgi:hypothetical protein
MKTNFIILAVVVTILIIGIGATVYVRSSENNIKVILRR